MTRFPPLDRQTLTGDRKRVADLVDQRRDGGLAGPFVPLVYVPLLLDPFQALGEYCRFNPLLPRRLVELAILICGRHVGAEVEFHVHIPPALRFGIAEDAVDALRHKRRPASLDDEEALVFDFCIALLEQGAVPDSLYGRLEAVFGRAAILNLTGVCGYYSTLGLVLNVSQMGLSSDIPPPFVVTPDEKWT